MKQQNTKLQFQVIWKDLPADQFNPKSWGGPGAYRTPQEPNKIFFIGDWSVDVVYSLNLFTEVKESEEKNVSEDLLLKAIAAEAHAKVLS